jgi:dCTP deaminase
MIINGLALINAKPIKDMTTEKHREHGVSWGLSEVGYDLRVKQEITFEPPNPLNFFTIMTGKFADGEMPKWREAIDMAFFGYTTVQREDGSYQMTIGRTALASSVEEFQLPSDLWGELRNKSTHARRFMDCTIGTDMEPGWKGFLTLEIIFHGNEPIIIPAGSAIAKAVFHELKCRAKYDGKYQFQPDKPIPAILEINNES